MALIYQKLSEKTLILAPREAVVREFDFGNDWTDLRLGVFITFVSNSDDNAVGTGEAVTYATEADRFFWGIKDTSLVLPGFAGSNFIGSSTPAANGGAWVSDGRVGNSAANTRMLATVDTTQVIGSTNNGPVMQPTITPGAASGYQSFAGIRINVTDRGLASQSVTVYQAYNTVSGTDYSAEALRASINAASWSGAQTLTWNDGASARPIPSAFFMYFPFYLNRARLSAMRAIRIA